MEHHYLITADIPELAGREREIVNTTDYSGEIYLRQERRGALIGTYEPHGVVWAPRQTPDDFTMSAKPCTICPPFPGRRNQRPDDGWTATSAHEVPRYFRASRGASAARVAQTSRESSDGVIGQRNASSTD